MSKIEVNTVEPQCGTTLTLGASGDTVALASGASQTGFGRTGTVDWDTTPKTATFSAVSGNGYFCNTTAGAFTVNLPAGVAGAIVSIADYAGTFQTSNLTISPNGSEKIGGLNIDVTLNTEGQSVTLVFVDSTQGWVTTADSTENVVGNAFICASVSGACNTLVTAPCCANVKIATFTGPGNFTVNAVSVTAAENTVGYMVVAGGAGGGGSCAGGGGGAGGFREGRNVPVDNFTASSLVANAPTNALTITAQTYPIVVGAGGAGSIPGSAASNGSVSTFGSISSTGGGKGGLGNNVPATRVGSPGGSGGGGGHTAGTAGCGNTPPVSPAQGFRGEPSQPSTGPAPSDAGGGGGGATTAGVDSCTSHAGGAGATTSISATPTAYAGGGGGSNRCGGTPGDVAGGTGGGGRGAFGPRPGPAPEGTGQAGSVNTGGGGGAGKLYAPGPTSGNGGTGGSGIVLIRYKFQ